MQDDSRVVKVGAVVPWDKVPNNAAVLGPKRVVFVRRGLYVDYHVDNVGRCSMHIFKACPLDQVVTVIALDVPREESADDLRRLAEIYEARAVLIQVAHEMNGRWVDGLDAAAERLHAAGWRPGMTAEDAARMLAAHDDAT